MPTLVWTVLYYLGLFAGAYFLTAVGFMLFARLEKDEDGSLIIDPESLHYRACAKCYQWKMYRIYRIWESDTKVSHVEYYQIGLCGYFWRVFWAFILLPIGYVILGIWQTFKTVIYAPFMFLFGYYPWPTLNVMEDEVNPFAVEMKRIAFPRVFNFELKPYLVVFPVLYGWLFSSYPQEIWRWTFVVLVIVLVIAMLIVIASVKGKVEDSENPRVVLVREYIKASKQGICPLVKVKSKS